MKINLGGQENIRRARCAECSNRRGSTITISPTIPPGGDRAA